MSKKSPKKPTEAEMAILQVLWEQGPCTVRQVHDTLRVKQQTGYTTILKIMQIMFDKDLVKRNENQRAHIYSAKISQEVAQGNLLSDLLGKAFSGSRFQLVVRALDKKASPEEIEEIREYLDQLEKQTKG